MVFDEKTPIPLRALNEYCYCPRLFYIRYVDEEFAYNEDVVRGEAAHDKAAKRSDSIRGKLEDVDVFELPPKKLKFGSDSLLFIGELDAIQYEDGSWIPVEAKKSKSPRPDSPQSWNGYTLQPGSWYNDQIQVLGQMYILRQSGYKCDSARIYYRGNRRTVDVLWQNDSEKILSAIAEEIRSISVGNRPIPLNSSPKCVRCSLNEICIPDETTYIKSMDDFHVDSSEPSQMRMIIPSRYDRGILYVDGYDKKISLDGDTLVVTCASDGLKTTIPIIELQTLTIMGTSQISTQCLCRLMENNVKIMFCSSSGWLLGHASSFTDKNVIARKYQFERFPDLKLARLEISAKIANQRLLIRRKKELFSDDVLDSLSALADSAAAAEDFDKLRGIEGKAAVLYFSCFNSMLGDDTGFSFENRNRRPPTDPVNAMLSYLYSLLVHDMVNAVVSVGLEPSVGFFHVFEKGRPSLALDLMESYRPIICDSVVVRVINTGMISPEDFESTKAGVFLKPKAKKILISAYEKRMDTLVQHPLFSYSMCYRRILEVEVRLLMRHLEGELKSWRPFRPR